MQAATKRNKQERPSDGGPTSAAAMNVSTGFRDDQFAVVEGGKRIYWYELLRSVNQAFDDLCQRKPEQYRKYRYL